MNNSNRRSEQKLVKKYIDRILETFFFRIIICLFGNSCKVRLVLDPYYQYHIPRYPGAVINLSRWLLFVLFFFFCVLVKELKNLCHIFTAISPLSDFDSIRTTDYFFRITFWFKHLMHNKFFQFQSIVVLLVHFQ